MDKEWMNKVKDRLDSWNARMQEITTALNELTNELRIEHRIDTDVQLVDERNLIWKVKIDSQRLTISEEEIVKEQIIEGRNEFGEIVETDDTRDVKEALQDIILKKLR